MKSQEPLIVLPEGYDGIASVEQSCKEYIASLVRWIRDHSWLLDSHAVDFFIKDYWNSKFPQEWQCLKDDKHCTMLDLLQLATHGTCKPEWPESLKTFVKTCKTLPLPRNICKVSSDVRMNTLDGQGSDAIRFLKSEPTTLDPKITFGMNKKKIHEVERLSTLIHNMAQLYDISHILDMGSGQGYLDSCLVFQHGYTVVGVDDNDTQTCGARWNAEKIQKQLKTKKLGAHKRGSLLHVNRRIHPSETFAEILSSVEHIITSQDHGANSSSSSIVINAALDEKPWLLCGLHTCGDLAPSMLRQFVHGDAQILVGVGCCYQHVTERPTSSTKHKDSIPENGPFGYPMSQSVSSHGLDLGFSCRMIACQAVCRWLEDPESSASNFTKHFYRALLQLVMYEQQLLPPERFLSDEDIIVGRLSRRKAFGQGFLHYARAAFCNLRLTYPILEVSDDVLQEYERRYNSREKEIAVVWTLRSLMAEVLESLILMDRFMYLLEQNKIGGDECRGSADSSTRPVYRIIPALLPLFDHRESPRNMVIIGIKERI